MTEEIIIDGVNVAGCMFLCTNTAGHICCGDDIREDKIPFANICQENNDCYYKQLKRLEQENKELKEYSQRMENQRENYYKEYNNYRSALEEIRILATKNVSIENFVKIQNKINEVLNDN